MPYIHPSRLEFVVTDACTGRCRHCGEGERESHGQSVDREAAVRAVKSLAGRYAIESVMTFGGEPLLRADTVCAIHAAARDCGIPERQIITNGFFSKDERRIDQVAKALCEAGVNDILVSVDCFHQEFIPVAPVVQFAQALLRYDAPRLRAHPVWVVNEEHENPYNAGTKRILEIFTGLGMERSAGNNIGPSANAVKHLGEYFDPPGKIDLSQPCGSMPYTAPLDDVRCVCVNPDGEVRLCGIGIGNICRDDILDIVDRYDPYANPAARAVLTGGVAALLEYAAGQGIAVDTSGCRSACGVCRRAMGACGPAVGCAAPADKGM